MQRDKSLRPEMYGGKTFLHAYPSLKLLTSPNPSRALDYQIHDVKVMYSRYCLQAVSLAISFFDDYP